MVDEHDALRRHVHNRRQAEIERRIELERRQYTKEWDVGERRASPDRRGGDRRMEIYGALLATAEPISTLENRLDLNCAGRWSIVLEAQAGEPERAQAAMEDLCRAYWHPIYAYARRSGQSPADAEDLTQAFFALLIEKDTLAAAAKDRGKLRTFLLTIFKRFLADDWRHAHAEKRGGGSPVVSIDQIL